MEKALYTGMSEIHTTENSNISCGGSGMTVTELVSRGGGFIRSGGRGIELGRRDLERARDMLTAVLDGGNAAYNAGGEGAWDRWFENNVPMIDNKGHVRQ